MRNAERSKLFPGVPRRQTAYRSAAFVPPDTPANLQSLVVRQFDRFRKAGSQHGKEEWQEASRMVTFVGANRARRKVRVLVAFWNRRSDAVPETAGSPSSGRRLVSWTA
jgi:hypothetical protein